MVVIIRLIESLVPEESAEIRQHLIKIQSLRHPGIYPFNDVAVAQIMNRGLGIATGSKCRLVPEHGKYTVYRGPSNRIRYLPARKKPFRHASCRMRKIIPVFQAQNLHIVGQVDKTVLVPFSIKDCYKTIIKFTAEAERRQASVKRRPFRYIRRNRTGYSSAIRFEQRPRAVGL